MHLVLLLPGLMASYAPKEPHIGTLIGQGSSYAGQPLIMPHLPTVIQFGPLQTKIPTRFGSVHSLMAWAKGQRSRWDTDFVPSFVTDFEYGDNRYRLIGFDVFSGRSALILLCYIDDDKGCRLASANLQGVDLMAEPNRFRRGDEERNPGSEPFSARCEQGHLILGFGGVDLAKTEWPLGRSN